MKLLELYTSTQGEGPNTGVPIQFIRFAGCNMRCPGWPCDTPQAIFPEQYTDEYVNYAVPLMMEEISPWPRYVCITGGEPFMQKGMADFIKALTNQKYNVDIFTNGSFRIDGSVINDLRVRIIMDWKLQGSGEAETMVRQRVENLDRLTAKDSVKFVVKDHDDLEEARELTKSFKEDGVVAGLWVGAAWGHIDDAEIVDYVLQHELDWRLNVQQHKYVWDPDARYT